MTTRHMISEYSISAWPFSLSQPIRARIFDARMVTIGFVFGQATDRNPSMSAITSDRPANQRVVPQSWRGWWRRPAGPPQVGKGAPGAGRGGGGTGGNPPHRL